MPVLVPDLAKEMALFNRKAIDFARDARLRQEPNPSARYLTRLAVTRGSDASEYWRTVQEALREGVPAERAREIVEVARDVADTWLELAQAARSLWKDAECAGGAPEGLDELGEFEGEVREVRAAVDRAGAFLSRPRQPIDAERLRRGLAEAEQGKVKSAKEMRDLFQAKQA